MWLKWLQKLLYYVSNIESETVHRKIGDNNNFPKIFPSFQELITAECPVS